MKKDHLSIGIVILSFLLGIYFYSIVPDVIPSHWNAMGEVDGYTNRFWGIFLLPIIIFLLYVFLNIVPKIDPRMVNIDSFSEDYKGIILVTLAFLFYVYLLTISWALGYQYNMIQMMSVGFAGLFYYIGSSLENIKSNFFLGIRTPWTLSDERVWEKTHKLGGNLFKLSGIISFFGLFFKSIAFILVFVPIVLVSIFSVVYSYVEYKKIHKEVL